MLISMRERVVGPWAELAELALDPLALRLQQLFRARLVHHASLRSECPAPLVRHRQRPPGRVIERDEHGLRLRDDPTADPERVAELEALRAHVQRPHLDLDLLPEADLGAD